CVDASFDFQRLRRVDVRVAYDVLQVPLYRVNPVLAVEQVFDAPRRVGVGDGVVYIVVVVVIRYGAFKYLVGLFGKHDSIRFLCLRCRMRPRPTSTIQSYGFSAALQLPCGGSSASDCGNPMMFRLLVVFCIRTTGLPPYSAVYFAEHNSNFREDRLRLGRDKIENFVFFCHCARLSLSLEKIGFGSAKTKPKTSFSFAATLAFRYLCMVFVNR